MKKFAEPARDDVNEWLRTCRDKQPPYIILSTRGGYSSIQWDYIQFRPDIQKVIRSQSIEVHISMTEIFIRHSNKNSTFEGTALVGIIKGIDVENAIQPAGQMFNLLSKHAHKYSPNQKTQVDSR